MDVMRRIGHDNEYNNLNRNCYNCKCFILIFTCGVEALMSDRMDGFRAIALLIKQSAKLDPNPKIGRVMPKGFEYLERYE